MTDRVPDTFFVPLDGNRFEPTVATRGPWDPRAQHGGPPAALLGRAVEAVGGREDVRVARITFELLRPVPLEPLTVGVEVVRPGRRVELVEASLHAGDVEVVRARAWRVLVADLGTTVEPPAGAVPDPPGRGVEPAFFDTGSDVGYHTAMEWRFVAGTFRDLGPATAWLRMRHPLVAGESPSALQRVLVAADSCNGVSASLDYRRYLFINTDLTVHLHRLPVGEWVCLDAHTVADRSGVGLSQGALWDERGPLGRALQTLLVAPRD